MKRSLKTGVRQSHLDVWLLLLRILVAVFMFTHGFPKFMRLMAGGEIRFGDPIGLGPEVSLVLAIFAEVICSTFVLIGLATRLAVIPLSFTMLVAAFIAHGPDPFAEKETALLYFLIYITLWILGSGKYSVDYLLRNRLTEERLN